MASYDLKLVEKHRTTPTISTFTFSHEGPETLPVWSPGAHVSVKLSDGKNRDYSLCGVDPEAGTWTIAVQRDPKGRGGSMELHDHVVVGSSITVSEPLNTFQLEPAETFVFVAGGIGITPIIPMIEQLEREGHRDWKLLYLVRERQNAIFLDRIKNRENIELWVSEEQGSRYDLRSLFADTDTSTAVYACGPTAILTELEELWAENPDKLHTEHFVGYESALEGNEIFEVELSRSGKIIAVLPHESILTAVEAAAPGLAIYQSCLEGVCGSCETKVLSGTPDHRDLVLTRKQKERNDRMMICVSRATCPKLVLDL